MRAMLFWYALSPLSLFVGLALGGRYLSSGSMDAFGTTMILSIAFSFYCIYKGTSLLIKTKRMTQGFTGKPIETPTATQERSSAKKWWFIIAAIFFACGIYIMSKSSGDENFGSPIVFVATTIYAIACIIIGSSRLSNEKGLWFAMAVFGLYLGMIPVSIIYSLFR